MDAVSSYVCELAPAIHAKTPGCTLLPFSGCCHSTAANKEQCRQRHRDVYSSFPKESIDHFGNPSLKGLFFCKKVLYNSVKKIFMEMSYEIQ